MTTPILTKSEVAALAKIAKRIYDRLDGETHSEGSKHGMFLAMPEWSLVLRGLSDRDALERVVEAARYTRARYARDCAKSYNCGHPDVDNLFCELDEAIAALERPAQ